MSSQVCQVGLSKVLYTEVIFGILSVFQNMARYSRILVNRMTGFIERYPKNNPHLRLFLSVSIENAA